MKNSLSHLRPLSKLGVVTFVAFLSLIVSFIVAAVLAIPFFGTDSFSAIIGSNKEITQDNVALLKFFQLVQSVGLFIIPSLLVAILFGQSVWGYLKLNKRPFIFSVLLSVLIIFVSNPLINFTGELNSKLVLPGFLSGLESWMKSAEDSAAELTKLFLKTDSFGGLLFNLFLIALIPAVGEEFLFRGIIQRIFKEWTKNDHWAIWISAMLFSGLHFQFYGFLPRAILGAMFGYLFVISGNLWLPVLSHFLNNAVAVIAYYLNGEGILNVDPEKIGADTKYQFATILSIFFLILLFRALNKYEKSRGQKLNVD